MGLAVGVAGGDRARPGADGGIAEPRFRGRPTASGRRSSFTYHAPIASFQVTCHCTLNKN